MGSEHRGIRGLSWFLAVNLLVVRFWRPIVPLLDLISFRLWIDWLLLATLFFSRKALHAVKPSAICLLIFAGCVVVHNLIVHGIGAFGIVEAINLALLLSLPLFYANLTLTLSADARRAHQTALLRVLNVYFFGNALLIWFQYQGVAPIMPGFLAENPAVIDHLTGLIGMNGVSTLNFLWIATIAANFQSAISERSRGRFIAGLMQAAIAGLLSSLNDNKMFFLTAAVAMVVFVVVNRRAVANYVLLFSLPLLLAAPLVVDWVGSVFTTASGRSLDLPSIVLFDPNFQPNENNERAYLNFLAFRYYDAAETGVGLGFVNDGSKSIHEHIGINSASLLLMQGGVPLLVAAILTLYVGFSAIFGWRGAGLAASLMLLSVVLMYASNPIADRYTLTAVCMFLFFIAPAVDASVAPDSAWHHPRSSRWARYAVN